VNFQEVVHSALTGNSEVAKHQRFAESRTDVHENAPLTPKGREAMVLSVVEGGLSKAAAARRFNVTPKTVAKWVNRFRIEGVDGLRDCSSRPHSLPSQTPAATCAAVAALRRQRHTGKQIAAEVGVSAATVSRVLRRLGLNRLSALEPAEPARPTPPMKFATDRSYSAPEKAARRIMEHARVFKPSQDGRIYIEKINYPMLCQDKATPAEY
jgi:transposase